MTDGPPILIVRHRRHLRQFYDVVMHWARLHVPELGPMVDRRFLPVRPETIEHARVLVSWLQDPVQWWSEEAYEELLVLQAVCDERGVPVVNRVERLTNAGKVEGSRLIREAGLRTPATVRIDDPEEFRETLCGLQPPLFVREDWGHNSPFLRADSLEEARALPIDQLDRPVATELVDVDPGDGRYRKLRYIAAGEIGVPHHLHVTTGWISRGDERIADDDSRDEELAYIAGPDPNHDRFQAARKLLGLDFVAFDYGHDADGNVVVWEANPYPFIRFSTGAFTYRNRALHRTVAAMLHLYLERAGLEIPATIRLALEYD